jgi:hypothetical protein
MQALLNATYSLGGIAAAFFHVPQLSRLWKRPEGVRAISRTSWFGWFVISCNTLAYATVVNGDGRFIGIAALNLLCQTCMLAVIVRACVQLRRAPA